MNNLIVDNSLGLYDFINDIVTQIYNEKSLKSYNKFLVIENVKNVLSNWLIRYKQSEFYRKNKTFEDYYNAKQPSYDFIKIIINPTNDESNFKEFNLYITQLFVTYLSINYSY